MVRLLALLLLGAGAVQEAEFGTAQNPIRCDGVKGERRYLARLRSPEGDAFEWKRDGSIGAGPDKHILDRYRNGADATLCLDLYHPRYVEIRAPKGYRLLTEWSEKFEYVDGKVHAFKDPKPYTGVVEEKGPMHELKATLKDGVVQGSLVTNYPGGKLMRDVQVGPLNRTHGTESWYRDNGKPWAVYQFDHGILHGKFEVYAEDGSLEASGVYDKGELKEEQK